MRLKNGREFHTGKRLAAIMTAASLLLGSFLPAVLPVESSAAPQPRGKVITMKACRSLAILNSTDYESAEDAVASKQAAYESAVKALRVKEKDMWTFRWSPLLSFKFPTSPDFAQASEFQNKPMSLAYDIQVAQHNLQDKTFGIAEKVNNLYVEIVVLQETIEFNERRTKALEEGLAKNRAKLKLGEANQSDVDKQEKTLETINNKIASDRRTLEADLQKLSKMINLDVSTGYRFEKPFVEATIQRSSLAALTQYTLDRDESYYEACIKSTTARAELQTNSGLMRNKYGGDYNMIGGYVQTALNGGSVNKKAFKKQYKAFVDKIDSYWQGKKRIIFIKIPRLWFKGSMDGTRYIEDDPYALFQNVLDYSGALTEQRGTEEELRQSVTDSFNNYISIRNSYEQAVKEVDKAGEQLAKDALLNQLGELTFEEYDSEMQSYEELQNGMLDAMKLYTTTLYSFDRLTCGGISAILSGTDADMQTAVVGESYVEKNTTDGATYSLRSIIQNQEFELSVFIPEDFEVDITDYELWVDNVLVGDRTAKDKKLRHLALVKDNVTEVKIRLYNDGEFVDDCVIDPSSETGPLTITTGYEIKKKESDVLGSYTINISEVTGMLEFGIDPEDKEVKTFLLRTAEGKAVGGETKKTEIGKKLRYITALQDSLTELKVELYDEAGSLLYTGRFDDTNGLIRKEDADE